MEGDRSAAPHIRLPSRQTQAGAKSVACSVTGTSQSKVISQARGVEAAVAESPGPVTLKHRLLPRIVGFPGSEDQTPEMCVCLRLGCLA